MTANNTRIKQNKIKKVFIQYKYRKGELYNNKKYKQQKTKIRNQENFQCATLAPNGTLPSEVQK